MVAIGRLIGGPGTGKTTRLLEIMEKLLERVHDPLEVGFVSFTTAAVNEARNRAAYKFGLDAKELGRDGWFRTMHSVCYRALGVGKELLASDFDDWCKEHLNEQVSASIDQSTTYGQSPQASTTTGRALAIWDYARNRMIPAKKAWDAFFKGGGFDVIGTQFPGWEKTRQTIDRYEQAKRVTGRIDFVDMIAMFAGVRFTLDGPERVNPDGFVPPIAAWFFDEAQDFSALLHEVYLRLINESCKRWAYLVGDAFQAIYPFAGSDSRYFMETDVSGQDVMPRSYRCPRPIWNYGQRVIQQIESYHDWGIQPSDHEGEIERQQITDLCFLKTLLPAYAKRGEDWLIIARTNQLAAQAEQALATKHRPFRRTRGNSKWDSPRTTQAWRSLRTLEGDWGITGEDWANLLNGPKCIPMKWGGESLIVRGTKAAFRKPDIIASHSLITRDDLLSVGATEHFVQMIHSGRWRDLHKAFREREDALEWGEDEITSPSVRVGTIHSVKGQEADNVLLINRITKPIRSGMKTRSGQDDERKVWYVGITRARKRLVVLNCPNYFPL